MICALELIHIYCIWMVYYWASFPTLSLVMSHRLLEIGHNGSIYNMKIWECYKWGFRFLFCSLYSSLEKVMEKMYIKLKKKRKGKKKNVMFIALTSSSHPQKWCPSSWITPKKWKKYASSTWKLLPDSERSCLNHWLICQVVTLLHGLTFFLLINIKENISHHSSRNYTLLLQL